MTTVNRRDKFRKECNKLYLPYYDNLCDELPEYWQPYCVFRDGNTQDSLFSKHLSKAQAYNSAHQYSCGSDWTIWEGNHPEWPEFNDAIWGEYVRACEKVGLETLDFERPHNELRLNIRWARIGDVFRISNGLKDYALGMEAANKAIRKHKKL